MKKTIALCFSFLMLVSLCSCIDINIGKKSNEISKMYDNGYTCTIDTIDDDYWYGILQKGDSYYRLTASLSKEDKEDYNELSAADDDYEEDKRAFLFDLNNITKEDLEDKVPTEFELKRFIGITYEEFENSGFENMGNYDGENGMIFMFDNSVYSCDVTFDAEITDMDDWSQNDLRQLKIADVKFTGFSQDFLLP